MFTGLIEEIGTIAEVKRGQSLRLSIRASAIMTDLKLGDSVAVNGVCLTAEELASDRFFASLLPETAAATTLGGLRVGQRVNLERALRVGDRLGGHFVAGHVDGLASVVAISDRGDTKLITLESPAGLARYLVDKGSVALDGVSLTVREPAGRRFAVSLVGVTLAATTLGELRVGDKVNMEADLLAKNLERLLLERGSDTTSEKLLSWLAE
jgi:riboflavin synthase